MSDFMSKPYPWDESFLSEEYEAEQRVQIRNISCSECRSYDFCRDVEASPQNYTPKTVSPIRRCTMQAIRDGLSEIEIAGNSFLEIGCGDWEFCRDRIEEQGGHWTGIDVFGSSVTSAIFDGINLPFSSDTFDFVISNQALEHVHDHSRRAPGRIVRQWATVLKPNGVLFANVPIHLHGSRNFRFGNLDAIIRMFPPIHFSELQLVYYRRDYSDLAPARVLIDYASGRWIMAQYPYASDLDTWRRKPIKQKLKIKLALAKPNVLDAVLSMFPRNVPYAVITENPYLKSAYVLDVRAKKRVEV